MPFRGLLMLPLFLALAAQARGDDMPRLADFPAAQSDLPWTTVNDNVMGGRSRGGFALKTSFLRFEGSTNTNGGGFSSIRSARRSFDLSGHEGIRLRVRGDGRTYTFRLTTSDTRRGRMQPSYWADFRTKDDGAWQVVDVPFDAFRPQWRGRRLAGPALDPAAIDSLGLMIYDKRDGPFRLDVDWIGAYRSDAGFTMDELRWSRRPLLVFGPDVADPRVRRQLAAVDAARKGFAERDMELILVLERGRSEHDGRPIADADVRGLRWAFGIGEGDFGVRLVGKDGGVKRSSDAVVPMAELFDQIDAMPMRRAEMRQRTVR